MLHTKILHGERIQVELRVAETTAEAGVWRARSYFSEATRTDLETPTCSTGLIVSQ